MKNIKIYQTVIFLKSHLPNLQNFMKILNSRNHQTIWFSRYFIGIIEELGPGYLWGICGDLALKSQLSKNLLSFGQACRLVTMPETYMQNLNQISVAVKWKSNISKRQHNVWIWNTCFIYYSQVCENITTRENEGYNKVANAKRILHLFVLIKFINSNSLLF